jgi:hypothetical protein
MQRRNTGTLGDRSDNTTFQMVPPPYGSIAYTTVNAATGTWYQWADNNGTITVVLPELGE